MNEQNLPKKEGLSCQELSKSRFSSGDLYMLRKSGKRLKLLGLGDIVDHSFIDRFKNLKGQIVLDRMTNNVWIDEISSKFLKLKDTTLHSEKDELKIAILKIFKSAFWNEESVSSLVDLMIAGERSFYAFDDELTLSLQNSNSVYYQRASLMGFLSAITALCMGYVDYNLLKDIYHICFLFDYSFSKEGITYNVAKAQELERKGKGRGVALLIDSFESDKELDLLQDHIGDGKDIVKSELSRYFTFKSVFNLIDFHHEKIDGAGFTEGVSHLEVSDLEAIIMFLNERLSYDFKALSFDDGRGFYKNQIDEYLERHEGYAFSRFFKIVKTSFESFNIVQEEEIEESEEIKSDDGKIAA